MKQAVADAVAAGRDALPSEQRDAFLAQYRAIIQQGLEANPLAVVPAGTKKRGRAKQTKTRNLLDRLDQHQDAVLRFMEDFRVPYTNNQAEQDIRISRCIKRSPAHFGV
ncbi:MAG: IS66 family transposase [Firmicutes bacterium]|nr:IS66 family transposase [Bacillota bacterium]